MLLAIDPGLSTGWAEYTALGGLYRCAAGDPRQSFVAVKPEKVIIERPQIYTAARSKGDPNDLITLAIQVGEYKQFFATSSIVMLILPRDWKGQVPKPVHHQRIFAHLKPNEQEIVSCAGKGLNAKALGDMMDAVGLGLFAMGRCRVGCT